MTIRTRDGREVLVSVSTANLEDREGRVVGGVEMFRDLSMLAELRRQIHGSYTSDDIVSKSPGMQRRAGARAPRGAVEPAPP